jgi:prepilin-type N-terminal cleavage/methylation domain-containing protein
MTLSRKNASFTLLEMLVGLAVFSLLSLLLFTILNSATEIWLRQSAEEESFREARAALNTLSRDLGGAVVSTNQNWFYADSNFEGTQGPQLAFLTTLPQDAQPEGLDNSDICVVGYSLEYTTNDAAANGPTNMSLYRYIAFSGWTYTNSISGGAAVNSIFAAVDGVNVVKALIARDITQFTFVSYTNTYDGSGNLLPETQSILPAVIDVGLTALNDRTAKILITEAMWQNSSSTLIQKNQENFRLRMRTIPQ